MPNYHSTFERHAAGTNFYLQNRAWYATFINPSVDCGGYRAQNNRRPPNLSVNAWKASRPTANGTLGEIQDHETGYLAVMKDNGAMDGHYGYYKAPTPFKDITPSCLLYWTHFHPNYSGQGVNQGGLYYGSAIDPPYKLGGADYCFWIIRGTNFDNSSEIISYPSYNDNYAALAHHKNGIQWTFRVWWLPGTGTFGSYMNSEIELFIMGLDSNYNFIQGVEELSALNVTNMYPQATNMWQTGSTEYPKTTSQANISKKFYCDNTTPSSDQAQWRSCHLSYVTTNTNVEYIGVRVDSNSGVGGTPGSIHVFANAGLWPSKISLGTLFQTTSHCKYSQL